MQTAEKNPAPLPHRHTADQRKAAPAAGAAWADPRPQASALRAAQAAMAHSPRAGAQRALAAGIQASPAMVVQRLTLHHLFGGPAQAVVQRHPTITGFVDGPGGSAIEQFLRKHGVHHYHSYDIAAQDVDGSFGDSAPEALRLARLLGARMAQLDSGNEVQADVQRKLLEICELVRVQIADRAPSAAESPQQRAERLKWYEQFLLNGLCLGFVRVLEAHPAWMSAMWRTLRGWVPPHGLAVGQILEALNQHLQADLQFDDGRPEANLWEPVLLAKEAWMQMDDPSQTDENQRYRAPPVAVVSGVTGTPSAHHSASMRADKTWDVDSHDPGTRWGLVRAEIDSVIGQAPGRFHIIIYHGAHEMAVQYSRNAQGQRWLVCETNDAGIVDCASWDEVGLRVGRQLERAEDEFGVEVKALTAM